MTIGTTIKLFSILVLVSRTIALQVTPGSQCSPVCLDVAKGNITDPNASNTFATDIVCQDNDYSQTAAGRKFKTCMNCLQGSSGSVIGESDQAWFLYNLRFAANSCLFDLTHNITSAADESCVSVSTCGPLSKALQAGGLDPAEDTFSYCNVEKNVFLGSDLDKCVTCLGKGATKYLSNFLTVLQTGCLQRPNPRSLIGIQGDIFSNTTVSTTTMSEDSSSTTASTSTSSATLLPPVSPTSKGLSRETIAGIAAGVGALVLAGVFGFCFSLYKRKQKTTMSQLHSPLDSRFGSTNITSPNSGSFGDPYCNPQVNIKQNYSAKEMELLQCSTPPLPLISPSSTANPRSRGNTLNKLDTQSFNSSSPAAMPIHQAYLSDVVSPTSPATSTSTNMTYQMSRYSGQSEPKRSPRVPLPTIDSPQTPEQPSNSGDNKVFALMAPPKKTDITLTSKTYSPSRTRHPNAPQSNSVSNAWKRVTHLAGVGNSNASDGTPMQISGPMISHGNRFDFDIATRERLERERDEGPPTSAVAKKGHNHIVTPSSADSDKQLW